MAGKRTLEDAHDHRERLRDRKPRRLNHTVGSEISTCGTGVPAEVPAGCIESMQSPALIRCRSCINLMQPRTVLPGETPAFTAQTQDRNTSVPVRTLALLRRVLTVGRTHVRASGLRPSARSSRVRHAEERRPTPTTATPSYPAPPSCGSSSRLLWVPAGLARSVARQVTPTVIIASENSLRLFTPPPVIWLPVGVIPPYAPGVALAGVPLAWPRGGVVTDAAPTTPS